MYKWINNNENSIIYKLITVSKNLSSVLSDLTELLAANSNDVEPQSHEHRERVVKVARVRHINKMHPQMDSSAQGQDSLEENQEKTNITETITTFDDSYAQHIAETQTSGYIVNDTMPTPDLDMFLKRPVILGTFAWASTDALGAQLTSFVFPDVIQTATMQSKLEKMAFWRPQFEISIRMNGTPMHYGKLVFAWIPQAQQLNASYTSSYMSMFSNRWIQVSASANQTTVITVPFTHYKERITVGKQIEDIFTLYCCVSAPLNSVNGAPPSINFTVYARIVETGLSGYTYTTDWSAQSGRQKVGSGKIKGEAEIKSDGGNVISTSVSGLGDAVSRFSWVPVIGELASPISAGIKAVGSVLKWFGLSVPVNVETTHPMQFRQPRLLQLEDAPTTLTLGPMASLATSKDYALVNDTIEGSSILKFIQRPALMYVGTITTASAKGDILYSSEVNPQNMWCADYVTPMNPLAFVGTPVQFMSRFFDNWRGGLRFHISFIASHFHSLRVRIYYIPFYASASAPPAITETQGIDVVNAIVDITQETDYSFTIPYCQESEWMDIQPTLAINADRTTTNGAWGIQLINPLTSGAATVSPIYYQIFVSAAADFQFSRPNAGNVQNWGLFVAQSLSSTACEIPSSSMDCLLTKEYPIFGGSSLGRTNHGVFMGTEYTGVKQLTNMVQPIVTKSSTSTTVAQIFTYNPLDDSRIAIVAGTYFASYLYNMTTVFRYFRGGNRITCRSRDANLYTQVNANRNRSTGSSAAGQFSAVSTGVDYNTITQADVINESEAGNHFVGSASNPVDLVVPWWYKFKCALTKNHIKAGTFQNQIGTSVYINWWTTLANNSLQVCLGGADDYILGFQIGIPIASMNGPA